MQVENKHVFNFTWKYFLVWDIKIFILNNKLKNEESKISEEVHTFPLKEQIMLLLGFLFSCYCVMP